MNGEAKTLLNDIHGICYKKPPQKPRKSSPLIATNKEETIYYWRPPTVFVVLWEVFGAYPLDLPLHLGIHNAINANKLKLYETPLLEEEILISYYLDNI